jgi:hypothetical protein
MNCIVSVSILFVFLTVVTSYSSDEDNKLKIYRSFELYEPYVLPVLSPEYNVTIRNLKYSVPFYVSIYDSNSCIVKSVYTSLYNERIVSTSELTTIVVSVPLLRMSSSSVSIKIVGTKSTQYIKMKDRIREEERLRNDKNIQDTNTSDKERYAKITFFLSLFVFVLVCTILAMCMTIKDLVISRNYYSKLYNRQLNTKYCNKDDD